MKILQWSITVPKDKQKVFIKTAKNKLAPTWKRFGCIRYELLKVEEKSAIGRALLERNRYIERLYFEDDFELPSFFIKVKTDPKARKVSRMYEREFGINNIELRVLKTP